MKKTLALLSLIFCILLSVFSQVSADPEDEFYFQLQRWTSLGYVSNLPQYKPYPVNLIDEILTLVSTKGSEKEADKAKEIYNRIHEKKLRVKSETEGNFRFSEENARQIYEYAGLDSDFQFNSFLSAGFKFNVIATTSSSLDALPLYSTQPFFFQDMADLGPLSGSLETDGNIAIGKSNIYFMMGVNHSSFGPFGKNSIVLSSGAKHAPTFSFSWRPGKWNLSQNLLALSATNGSKNLFSNKYMFLHSVGYTFNPSFTFNFYEVSVLGGRLDPSYIIPLPYMVTQGISGYDDNIFMGANFSWNIKKGLEWSGDFLLDDFGVGYLTKGELNFKLRAAAITGLTYVSENSSWFSMAKADYTFVTPYMYSHWQEYTDQSTGKRKCASIKAVNYQEYTTAGKCLADSLEPNSDRISLSARFTPLERMTLDLKGTFIRHANVNEGLTAEEQLYYLNGPEEYFTTDGTIFNHNHYWKDNSADHYLPSAWNRLMLLTQDTKEYTFQLGAKASYLFPETKAGTFKISLGYTFEYIKNYGLDTDMFSPSAIESKKGSWNSDGSWTSGTYSEEDLETVIQLWKDGLSDLVNNYISINFKYTF